MLRRFAVSLLASLLATLASAEDPFADSLSEVREEFLLAYAAAETGAARLPDSMALRAYPLYAYLQAARIRHALEVAATAWTQADDDAVAFLDAHDPEPVGRSLRRSWLQSLARRGLNAEFLAELEPGGAEPALGCQELGARIALEETHGIEAKIVALWLTPEQLPAECEPVFQWLSAEGGLSETLIEERVRLLLQNGEAAFARTIAARLPQAQAAPLLLWADLIERPQPTLDALIGAPERPVEAAALLDGWQRLARRDPAAALERYRPLRRTRDLDREQGSLVALALALGLAWDRRPEALHYFAQVQPTDLDDYALSWQARAALWAGAWREVETSIEAMSDMQRGETRWRYWAARTAEHRRNPQRARELYASVLASDNYYAALASARIGQSAAPHAEPLPADTPQIDALALRPDFVRCRELVRVSFREQAILEWQHGFRALNREQRSQAVHLASRWGWHDVSVATATRQNVFFDYALLYPRPYDEAVAEGAALSGLEAPLIYAVIRQESLYRADAVSAKGARGLAQLMPDTARITARHWNQPVPQDLLDPAVNVRLGAARLRTLLDRFDGQLAVALAGYNAGENAAARWLPDQPLDADIWIENIPYNETRDYVQRVLWHSVVFGWLASGEPQNTESWLAHIRDAPADQPSSASAAFSACAEPRVCDLRTAGIDTSRISSMSARRAEAPR